VPAAAAAPAVPLGRHSSGPGQRHDAGQDVFEALHGPPTVLLPVLTL
jgi:hypothetical protein